MKKYILPICLWVSLAIIFVGGIILSEKTFTSNPELEIYGAIQEVYENYTRTEKRTVRLAEDAVTGAKVYAVYDVYEDDKLLGYAYLVSFSTYVQNVEKMTLMVYADPVTEKMLTYKVLSCDANDFYNQKLDEFAFLNRYLTNTNMSDKNYLDEGTFSAVSGATETTKAMINAIQTARIQFYRDINKELPVLSLTARVNKTTQIVEANVFNKFNAEMTVTTETLNNAKVNVVFEYNFETNEATYLANDKNLKDDAIELCMSKISAPTEYIKSYDAETNTFVVNTYFSFGSGTTFTTTIKLASDGTIETYEVTTSNGFTDNWQDKTAESNAFIASVPGTNISGIDSLEYVSGATHTSNAFKNALLLVKEYVGGAE